MLWIACQPRIFFSPDSRELGRGKNGIDKRRYISLSDHEETENPPESVNPHSSHPDELGAQAQGLDGVRRTTDSGVEHDRQPLAEAGVDDALQGVEAGDRPVDLAARMVRDHDAVAANVGATLGVLDGLYAKRTNSQPDVLT
jgi:hypothetical protein